MSIARERVVPALGRRAWVGFAGLGCAVGAALGLMVPWLAGWAMERALLGPTWLVRAMLAVNFAAIIALVLPVPILLRATQRWGPVLAFAGATIVAAGVASEGHDALKRPDGGAGPDAWSSELSVAFAIIVAGYVAVAAALRLLYRALIVRTMEAGPEDCRWCGYTRGVPGLERCPECGRPARDARYRNHAFVAAMTWLGRHGLYAMGVACVVLAAAAVRPIVARTIPSVRFYRTLSGWTPVSYRVWSGTTSAMSGWGAPEAPCVWRADAGGERGVYVLFLPGSTDFSNMIVGVSGDPASGLSMGSIRVAADLDARQAAWVLRHGVPDGLVQQLYETADQKAWMAASAPRGEVRVDASPFFPKEP